MAYIVGLAQELYDAAIADADFKAKLSCAYSDILMAVVDGSGTTDILGGTKNGSTYNARIAYTVEDRKKAMKMALDGLRCNVRPSSRTQSIFI